MYDKNNPFLGGSLSASLPHHKLGRVRALHPGLRHVELLALLVEGLGAHLLVFLYPVLGKVAAAHLAAGEVVARLRVEHGSAGLKKQVNIGLKTILGCLQ